MKTLKFSLLCICSIVVLGVVYQYLLCPVFTFQNATSFKGDSLYNPYTSTDSGQWIRCNFHSHVRCWNGVTNGKGTAKNMSDAYTQIHYDVHAISNYQNIDTRGQYLPNYISTYEHGYNILKNHQLVIGASKVCWNDYLLPQTVSNKQDIINRLAGSDTSAIIVINHPMVRNAYNTSDSKKLTNYTCMEVLNPACNSSSLWDVALSAGKPVFIIADDDTHDFSDTNRVGKISTWVNVPAVTKSNVLNALKTGCSYGLSASEHLMQLQRNGFDDSIPRLQEFKLSKNAVYVSFSMPAKDIIVSGQNGTVLKKISYSDSLSFVLNQQEPYARITALYEDGSQLLLNPVFRYSSLPLQQSPVFLNNNLTITLRCIALVLLILWFRLILNYRNLHGKQRRYIPGLPVAKTTS